MVQAVITVLKLIGQILMAMHCFFVPIVCHWKMRLFSWLCLIILSIFCLLVACNQHAPVQITNMLSSPIVTRSPDVRTVSFRPSLQSTKGKGIVSCMDKPVPFPSMATIGSMDAVVDISRA